jgi:hypothetical protein
MAALGRPIVVNSKRFLCHSFVNCLITYIAHNRGYHVDPPSVVYFYLEVLTVNKLHARELRKEGNNMSAVSIKLTTGNFRKGLKK